MQRKIVETDNAPAAIGPYSQAVTANAQTFTFLSGQIPLDPASGKVVGEGDVKAQSKQVMENMKAVLGAAGLDFGNVTKTTIYLVDMNDFAVVNDVYKEYFGEQPPARATIGVVALPMGVRVEMDCIAAS